MANQINTVTVNGVTYQVQGAGFTYDADKNSLAAGSKTTASGKDQYVFGRYNTEDTENKYAEIVGGGDLQEVGYLATLKATTENTVWVNPLGGSSIVRWGSINTINTNYPNGHLVVNATISGYDISTDIIGALFYEQPTTISETHYECAELITKDYKLWKPIDSALCSWYENKRYSEGVTKVNKVVEDTNVDGYLVNNTTVKVSRDIRKLDWDGNEEILGNLTVGGNLAVKGCAVINSQKVVGDEVCAGTGIIIGGTSYDEVDGETCLMLTASMLANFITKINEYETRIKALEEKMAEYHADE